MTDDDQKHKDQFNAALPLPLNDTPKPSTPDDTQVEAEQNKPAADIIRKRVEDAYANAPDAATEAQEATEDQSEGHKLSKHQRFIIELTSSGKPLHEIQMAWHEYYAGLPDHEKHAVWQEFYKTQTAASHYHAATENQSTKPKSSHKKTSLPHQLTHPATARAGKQLRSLRDSFKPADLGDGVKVRPAANPFHSLLFGLGIGCMIIVIFLFSFFNERFIAPFIQPSRNASNIPIISGNTPVSASPELIIPKINVQIPVIYATDNSDTTIENDLEGGVVHYAYTALPGSDGNLVIFGHSSNNIFNPGKYKFAFVLLHQLQNGDTFYIDSAGKRYTYEVYKKQIVPPSDVSVMGVTNKPATATLITCDPPGTSINRLVVTAEQISPSPSTNAAAVTNNQKAIGQTKILPSNSPSLWSRLVKWFWN